MTLNSVSTTMPRPTNASDLLVVAQERSDEGVDRRQRAGGFPGGKDDEILIVLVIVKLELVLFVLVRSSARRRGGLSPAARVGVRAARILADPARAGSPAPRALDLSGDEGLDAIQPTDAARPA